MGEGQPCSLVSLHPCPWWQIQTDAGVTGTGWLGESATLPDHALLGGRRCSAFCPVLLCEVGPVGPAPDCLPSHHHPMAGGLTHAASSSTESGDLGKKAETGMEKSHSSCFGVWHQRQLPALSRNVSVPLPPLQRCVPMSCLITTQTKWAPLWHKKMLKLPWVDFIEYEVKPYGDAYSLSPLDGAKSCSPPHASELGSLCLSSSWEQKKPHDFQGLYVCFSSEK